MKHQIRLTLNVVGIALGLSMLKWMIDLFLVMNQVTEYAEYVITPLSGYLALGGAMAIVSFRTNLRTRTAFLASYLFYWLTIALFNQTLAVSAYEHQTLTLLLLLLIGPIPGVLFAILGGVVGKILGRITGQKSSRTEKGTDNPEAQIEV